MARRRPRTVATPEAGGSLDLLTVWRVDQVPNVLYRRIGPGASPDDSTIPPAELVRQSLGTGQTTTITRSAEESAAEASGLYGAGGRLVSFTSARDGRFVARWVDPNGADAPKPLIPNTAAVSGEVPAPPGPTDLRLSPDGSRAALLTESSVDGQDPTLSVVDLVTGKEVSRVQLDFSQIDDFDGHRVIVTSYNKDDGDPASYVVDAATGQETLIETYMAVGGFLSAPGR